MDSQHHVQEGHQQRLRDLSREWGRCDGGCRQEYEQQAAGREDQAIRREASDYENWEDEYDKMYDKTE